MPPPLLRLEAKSAKISQYGIVTYKFGKEVRVDAHNVAAAYSIVIPRLCLIIDMKADIYYLKNANGWMGDIRQFSDVLNCPLCCAQACDISHWNLVNSPQSLDIYSSANFSTANHFHRLLVNVSCCQSEGLLSCELTSRKHFNIFYQNLAPSSTTISNNTTTPTKDRDSFFQWLP